MSVTSAGKQTIGMSDDLRNCQQECIKVIETSNEFAIRLLDQIVILSRYFRGDYPDKKTELWLRRNVDAWLDSLDQNLPTLIKAVGTAGRIFPEAPSGSGAIMCSALCEEAAENWHRAVCKLVATIVERGARRGEFRDYKRLQDYFSVNGPIRRELVQAELEFEYLKASDWIKGLAVSGGEPKPMPSASHQSEPPALLGTGTVVEEAKKLGRPRIYRPYWSEITGAWVRMKEAGEVSGRGAFADKLWNLVRIPDPEKRIAAITEQLRVGVESANALLDDMKGGISRRQDEALRKRLEIPNEKGAFVEWVKRGIHTQPGKRSKKVSSAAPKTSRRNG